MPMHRSISFAILLSAAACSQQDKKPRLDQAVVTGTWASDTLPTSEGPRRLYRLQIDSGGMAEFVTASIGSDSLVQRGTWDGADSLLRVVVRATGTAARPASLLLAIRGNRLGLVQFDSTQWGSGLTLYRR